MLIYSKTIQSFLKKVKKEARLIMSEEMGLLVRKSRFEWKGYLYPLHFVVFEDPKLLGYFNPANYQLGLHKKLMYLAKDEVLRNLIRHELAHLYTFLLFKEKFSDLKPHGQEFKEVCQKFGWGEEVSLSHSHLEKDNEALPIQEDFEKIKTKIQKLMALSQSENAHESEAATLKANEYLLKYNLQHLDDGHLSDEEETIVRTVYQQKRMNASLNALYDILQYFYVQPVFNRTSDGVSLDVVGSRLNTEMADYVAKVLVLEFEKLWKKAQGKNSKLKGLSKKNNYITGVGQGFSEKLKAERELVKKGDQGKNLILLQGVLNQRVAMAFPRLSRQKGSSARHDQQARESGRRDGRNLNLRPGVSQGNQGHLLGY